MVYDIQVTSISIKHTLSHVFQQIDNHTQIDCQSFTLYDKTQHQLYPEIVSIQGPSGQSASLYFRTEQSGQMKERRLGLNVESGQVVLLNVQIQKIVVFLEEIEREIRGRRKKKGQQEQSALLIEVCLQRLNIVVPQDSKSQNRLTFIIQKVGVYSHDPEQQFNKKYIHDLNFHQKIKLQDARQGKWNLTDSSVELESDSFDSCTAQEDMEEVIRTLTQAD